ncbi:MAG: hypothetical protein ABH810_00265 [bacterium]
MNYKKWLFIAGVLVAILLAFFELSYSAILLVILGLVVGFLNINEKEAEKFLVATTALLIIGTASFSVILLNGADFAGTIQMVLNNFVSFVASAAFVVALKTIVGISEK